MIRPFFRAILATLSFLSLAPSLALAGGAWDGIYNCNVALSSGSSPMQVYVTLNGQPDGRAIFAVAAAVKDTPLYGYGIGSISGGVFSGTTSFNKPFSLTATSAGFSGTVGIVWSGYPFAASAQCAKIW